MALVETERLLNGEGSVLDACENGQRHSEEDVAGEQYYTKFDRFTDNYSFWTIMERHGPRFRHILTPLEQYGPRFRHILRLMEQYGARLRQSSKQFYPSRQFGQRGVLAFIISAILILSLLGSARHLFAASTPAEAAASVTTGNHKPFFADLYEGNQATPGIFPLQPANRSHSDFCSICDCHADPTFYSPSPNSKFPPRPRDEDIQPRHDFIDLNEYTRKAILDMYCAHAQLSIGQSLVLLRNAHRDLGDVASWSLSDLNLTQPTIFLTTATSPNSKAKALRPQYFRRHGEAIKQWMSGDRAGWQVVWIVAEDEEGIDSHISRVLRRSGVPYVYFAYGLTRSWGNAQKNAVLQMTYAFSSLSGLLGHGPVYGLDDDNKIEPALLDVLIKVVRVGAFPIGNIPSRDSWEAPTINEEGLMTGTTSSWRRKFPFDYGAYTFNSSLLGTLISAPALWKYTKFGGESEFVSQIANSVTDVESLCATCHVVWHNRELTHEEETPDDDSEI